MKVIGVKFRKEGKIYDFDPGDLDLKKNDLVIVDTEHGQVLGQAVTEIRPASGEGPELKPVLRKASPEDLNRLAENRVLEQTARAFCIERVHQRNLPMKVIEAEYLFDRSKVIFYFTADNRVDFRELVKDLVQRFKIRIELKQIGARQEARIVKGLGVCGREVCCASLLNNLDRVSVKMAKEQGMSLNPEKISGLCGRLMCCLSYEYDAYAAVKKHMPKCGKTVQLKEGRAKILRHDVLKEQIAVVYENGKEAVINIEDLK